MNRNYLPSDLNVNPFQSNPFDDPKSLPDSRLHLSYPPIDQPLHIPMDNPTNMPPSLYDHPPYPIYPPHHHHHDPNHILPMPNPMVPVYPNPLQMYHQPPLSSYPDSPKSQKKTRPKRKGPKRPRSAYMFFCRKMRPRLNEGNSDVKFGEVVKLLGDAWKNLSEEEKKPYYQMNLEDRQRYDQDIENFTVTSDIDSEPDLSPSNVQEKKKKTRRKGPKRALTAYIYFAKKNRRILRNQYPDASFAEIGRLLGIRWANISPEERYPYDLLTAQDKDRFLREKESIKRQEYHYMMHKRYVEAYHVNDGSDDEDEDSDGKEMSDVFMHNYYNNPYNPPYSYPPPSQTPYYEDPGVYPYEYLYPSYNHLNPHHPPPPTYPYPPYPPYPPSENLAQPPFDPMSPPNHHFGMSDPHQPPFYSHPPNAYPPNSMYPTPHPPHATYPPYQNWDSNLPPDNELNKGLSLYPPGMLPNTHSLPLTGSLETHDNQLYSTLPSIGGLNALPEFPVANIPGNPMVTNNKSISEGEMNLDLSRSSPTSLPPLSTNLESNNHQIGREMIGFENHPNTKQISLPEKEGNGTPNHNVGPNMSITSNPTNIEAKGETINVTSITTPTSKDLSQPPPTNKLIDDNSSPNNETSSVKNLDNSTITPQLNVESSSSTNNLKGFDMTPTPLPVSATSFNTIGTSGLPMNTLNTGVSEMSGSGFKNSNNRFNMNTPSLREGMGGAPMVYPPGGYEHIIENPTFNPNYPSMTSHNVTNQIPFGYPPPTIDEQYMHYYSMMPNYMTLMSRPHSHLANPPPAGISGVAGNTIGETLNNTEEGTHKINNVSDLNLGTSESKDKKQSNPVITPARPYNPNTLSNHSYYKGSNIYGAPQSTWIENKK